MSRGEVIGPGPDVAALVERINRGHARCLDGARMAVEGAVDAGLALLEMKPHVGHGNWLAWVDANCTCGARQAQKYMRLARASLSGKCDLSSHLTVSGALAALVAPEPEPEDNEPKHDIRLRQLAADINQSHTKVLEHFDAIEAMRIELSRKNPGDPRYGSFRRS